MDIEISSYGKKLIKRIKRKPKNILDRLVIKFYETNGDCLLRALVDNNISGSKLEISILAKLYFSFAVEGRHYLFGIGRKNVLIYIYKNEEDGESDIEEEIELNLADYHDEYDLLLDIVKKFFYYSKFIRSSEFVIMKNKEGASSILKNVRGYRREGLALQILCIALEVVIIVAMYFGEFTSSIGGILLSILISIPMPVVGLLCIKDSIFYTFAYRRLKADIKADNLIKLQGRATKCKLIPYSTYKYGYIYNRIELTINGVTVYYMAPEKFNLANKYKAEVKSYLLKNTYKLEYYSSSRIINNLHSNANKIVMDKVEGLSGIEL